MVLQDDDGQTSSSSYVCNRFSLPIVDFSSVTDIKASSKVTAMKGSSLLMRRFCLVLLVWLVSLLGTGT